MDPTVDRSPATLTPDEQAELFWASSACPAFFTHHFGIIDDAQDIGGEVTGMMPFRLWPAQAQVMNDLRRERQVIILKARQLGISWLVCAYVLWLCVFRPGQVILLFSKGQAEANELIRRIKVLYDRLPGWFRERLPEKVEPDSTRAVAWQNGSRIQSMPATKSAGVSYTASLIVLDEAAHMMHAAALYLNAKPTIDGGGQLIILSTANGVGNLFHRLWDKAVSGINTFKTIFLPWWARPGRTKRWFAERVAESADPATIPQNYPANALEAFLVSGRVRFPSGWVTAQQKNVRDPLPRAMWPAALVKPAGVAATVSHLPGVRVYAVPTPLNRYVIAADIAEGKEDGDYDAAVVLDERTWEEVASIHGHWEPDEFADLLACLGRAYNTAPIIVERNNHGHAVITTLKLKRYPAIANGPDGDPGWLTNKKTKPESIDLLAECLRDDLLTIHTAAILGELLTYRVLSGGKTGAEDGAHDDWVMALAIGLAFIRLRRGTGSAGAPAVGGEPRPTAFGTVTVAPGPLVQRSGVAIGGIHR